MFWKVENETRLKVIFLFINYAFQKTADVISGCQSQMVHCHE